MTPIFFLNGTNCCVEGDNIMSKISAIAYNSLYVNMGHYNGSSWDHYQSHKTKITPSDIYRHALSGNILLSIYFQSPVILKKIQTFNGKIKFRQFVGDLLDKLCMLDSDGFIYGQNLRLCTEARYICPVQQIIDTPCYANSTSFVRLFVMSARVMNWMSGTS